MKSGFPNDDPGKHVPSSELSKAPAPRHFEDKGLAERGSPDDDAAPSASLFNKVALAIADADYILLVTGAGFSAGDTHVDVYQDCKSDFGIDYDDFDEMVSPVENFYDFAIGGWRKKNPTPPEYPSW